MSHIVSPSLLPLLYRRQISCDSSSPEEEDRNRFKRYFQILPNDIHLSQALAAIMDTFNWTKLHAIELEYGLFVQVSGFSYVCVLVGGGVVEWDKSGWGWTVGVVNERQTNESGMWYVVLVCVCVCVCVCVMHALMQSLPCHTFYNTDSGSLNITGTEEGQWAQYNVYLILWWLPFSQLPERYS